MATFQKRGDRWRARVRRGGADLSETFRTKAQAQAWANRIEAEIDDGKTGVQKVPDRPFADALERYAREVSPKKRTGGKEQIRIERMVRDDPLAKVLMSRISPADFSDWRDRRLKEVSVGTVLREWNLFSHVCSVAAKEWGWLRENPMTKVSRPREPEPRSRRLSEDEIKALLHVSGYSPAAPPTTSTARVGAALLFAIETAMRAGEICGLTWAHTDQERRVAHLPRSKAGPPRDVPLSQRAVALIKQLEPVTGEGDTVFGLKAPSLDALFRKIRDQTLIEDLHFHDTRREALSRLAAKVDVMTLAKISGHRDLRILQRVYYAPDMADVAAMLD